MTARSGFYLVGITTFQPAKRSRRVSSLKYQLSLVLPTLSSAARSSSSQEIKRRYYKLKAVSESRRDLAKACRLHGVSRKWYYSWGRKLVKTKLLQSLRSKSRRPKKSPTLTGKRVVRKIRELRKLEPFSGPDRISRDLKDHFNIHCPPRTVNNVLKREGLISQANSRALTKKHLKRYRRPMPGYLQMDFKHTPYLIEGKPTYQLSVVDHHSSWRLIRSYQTKDALAVKWFMLELEKLCPFTIFELQTDNDAAFTDKFTSQRGLAPTGLHALDEWCTKHKVVHKLIPIGQKELNGKVENTHKQDDRELFSQTKARTYKQLRLFTLAYNDRWNSRRKTKALKWMTPNEALEASLVLTLTLVLIHRRNIQPVVSVAPKPNSKSGPAVPKNKPRRRTAASRYLQWLDWDTKNRKKA